MDDAIHINSNAFMTIGLTKADKFNPLYSLFLNLDITDSNPNGVISYWSKKAENSQYLDVEGAINGDLIMTLSNGDRWKGESTIIDFRTDHEKQANCGAIEIILEIRSLEEKSLSPQSELLTKYDIKSITFDNKEYTINKPTAVTIKEMYDELLEK